MAGTGAGAESKASRGSRRPSRSRPVPRPSVRTPPTAGAVAASAERFTEPAADGTCPATHPVKAKLASGIFHVPGGGNYDRTNADRCYVDAAAAEADGLRAAKR